MSEFLNEKYKDLEVYTPGEQPQDMKYIKLNTNESPYPPSAGVIKAVNCEEVKNLRLYSDPECTKLRAAIAELYNVKKENVYLSNGSDDILNFSFMAFCSETVGAAFPEISYGFYKVFAELYGINYKKIPLKEDFSIDYKDYLGLNRLVVIANPNAPTGRCLEVAEIEEIVKSNPKNVVLIDEAYIDFGGESVYPLTKKYKNLLVVGTFSKSRSMAGARLGFAIADEELIKDLNRIKYSTNPYNVNRMTMAAGRQAILDDGYYMANAKKIIECRENTSERLSALGFRVLPSSANFLFAESESIDGELLYLELKRRGILVRHFNKERIRNFNRITVGTPEEMDALILAITDILKENSK